MLSAKYLILVSLLWIAFSVPSLAWDWEATHSYVSDNQTECSSMLEKVEIFLKLQKSVNQEFATIRDSSLCESMSAHCEHFYKQAMETQKFYRYMCDDEYEIVKTAKCNYSSNPCVNPRRKPHDGLHEDSTKTRRPRVVLDYIYSEN